MATSLREVAAQSKDPYRLNEMCLAFVVWSKVAGCREADRGPSTSVVRSPANGLLTLRMTAVRVSEKEYPRVSMAFSFADVDAGAAAAK